MAAPTRILHIIQQLSRGGAGRAMLNISRYSAQLGPFWHEVITLVPIAPADHKWARAYGPTILAEQPDDKQLLEAVADADIVMVHFWNTPELYRFLRMEKPAARMLAWLHVAGDTAPQILTEELLGSMDHAVAGCPYTAEVPLFAQTAAARGMVWTSADFERLAGIQPRPHAGFNVGYLGTVDFCKIHPAFIDMSAAVRIPEARFIVCGSGNGLPALRRQVDRAGASDRFHLRGYVENIRPFFETLDVFGYPLCAETYAGAEQVLQEAMYAGVPPVIFAHGGAQRTVIHGETGLVVRQEAEYTAAIETLYHHPEERRRLGANARSFAWRNFSLEKSAAAMNEVYGQMLEKPKQRRTWPGGGGAEGGALLFVQSLGSAAPQFRNSLQDPDLDSVMQAEALIRCSPPTLAGAGSGGVLHYRRVFPYDPHLRLWAGLVLLEQGRPALAAAEFASTRKLGLAHWRVDWYQAQAAAQAGSPELARSLARQAMEAAPGVEPVVRFLSARSAHVVD